MRGSLTFKLPEEEAEFKQAQDAWRAFHCIDSIWDKVFRPSRKHGYPHPKLQNLSERDVEVIEALIEIYQETTNEILNEGE